MLSVVKQGISFLKILHLEINLNAFACAFKVVIKMFCALQLVYIKLIINNIYGKKGENVFL